MWLLPGIYGEREHEEAAKRGEGSLDIN